MRALLEAGLTVDVMGLGDAAAGPPGVPVRVWPRGSMAARALRAVNLPWRARGRVLLLLDPDILLIDEAMSAGDAKFRKKASARMLDIANKAGTMLLVSHALGTIKDMCSEAIWLHNGRLIQRGEPDDVVAAYARFLEVGEDALTLEDI